VLIVEDHQDSRDALQLLLTLDGFDVTSAADGPGALEAARSRPPDIAVVDIGLPGLDGWTVAQILRRELHDLWLIALTSFDSSEDRRRSTAAGFDLHLVKPVWPDELRKAVRIMLLAEHAGAAGGSDRPHGWSPYWMVLPFGAAVGTALLMARRWTGSARHRTALPPGVDVPCVVPVEPAAPQSTDTSARVTAAHH
jgi:DNA-binding response OmpR family regulator